MSTISKHNISNLNSALAVYLPKDRVKGFSSNIDRLRNATSTIDKELH